MPVTVTVNPKQDGRIQSRPHSARNAVRPMQCEHRRFTCDTSLSLIGSCCLLKWSRSADAGFGRGALTGMDMPASDGLKMADVEELWLISLCTNLSTDWFQKERSWITNVALDAALIQTTSNQSRTPKMFAEGTQENICEKKHTALEDMPMMRKILDFLSARTVLEDNAADVAVGISAHFPKRKERINFLIDSANNIVIHA